MESRLGGRRRRRLGAQPPRRPHRRCRRCDGGDGVDRISGLNDDLLIEVLVRLRCAAAAARTSVLSRRWRGLWRHLPELFFRTNIASDALQAALAQVAIPKLSLLDIDFPGFSPQNFSAEEVASLLRTAARLDPVDLNVAAMVVWTDEPIAVELPSFARATSIRLRVRNLHLTPPAQGGDFPVLERLSIDASRFDIGPLISRCPYLRVLEVAHYQGLDPIAVHSATIEELFVTGYDRLGGLDIVAPVLKKFTLRRSVDKDFSMSLLAPKVENLSWNCRVAGFYPEQVVIDASGMWRLENLKLETEESGFVLRLDVGRPLQSFATHGRKLQEMFQLPNISVLELCVETCGHVYEAMVLNLLRIFNATRKLKLAIDYHMCWRAVQACPPDCPCNQPQNWRSQNISLSFEEVEIVNFKGGGHEVDFLKLLFRCAPLMNVTLKLASKVSPSSRGCKETYKIFKANPAAECHVYRKRGKEIIYT